MTSISVVICAHTDLRYNDVLEAVASVQRQTVLPDDIIIVIDRNPNLLARLKAQLGDAVVLLENKYEQGASGARNTGIEYSKSELFVFMDDDASAAENNWIELLISKYDDPTVAGTGGWLEPNWRVGKPKWFPGEFNWVVGCTYDGMPTTITPIRNLVGANMSMRRSVFDAVGLFNNNIGRIGFLPIGCEETEICIRYRQKVPNHEFLFIPEARALHNVPQARTTWKYFWSRCYHEGVSKALIVQLVGSSDGLAVERDYTMKILPLGVLRGLRDAIFKLDISGLGRATGIISGLFMTGIGYLYGKYKLSTNKTQSRVAKPSI